ncbi:MAG TPA: F0F1 ATP synthase subunit epsilon [Desulfobacteraceae bacterium]|nr:F0F1 ATP synthase subunit epsilon [Deltaproteobacteria bacterium]MBW2355315.1 F0F1 ATP synthase subunit epsilon [Deltaproteobacteria bacterium]HDI60587.1 F0F1 ATP synthase subunit epsilon [Desulfobacteraceae bacterium]
MDGNIRLEVVTPERQVVNEEAQIVMAPGSEGEFGVLIGHTPFMTSLKTGILRYRDSSGTERLIFVSGGFAEALPNKVTVLAESAERRRDIDVERARSALERAQKLLAAAKEREIDYVRARAALERALHRIRLVESRSRG